MVDQLFDTGCISKPGFPYRYVSRHAIDYNLCCLRGVRILEDNDLYQSPPPDIDDPPVWHQAADMLLLLFENLLAFRIVLGYLGAESRNFISYITAPLLFPFGRLNQLLTFYADNSRLELLPVILLFLFFLAHRYLDREVV